MIIKLINILYVEILMNNDLIKNCLQLTDLRQVVKLKISHCEIMLLIELFLMPEVIMQVHLIQMIIR